MSRLSTRRPTRQQRWLLHKVRTTSPSYSWVLEPTKTQRIASDWACLKRRSVVLQPASTHYRMRTFDTHIRKVQGARGNLGPLPRGNSVWREDIRVPRNMMALSPVKEQPRLPHIPVHSILSYLFGVFYCKNNKNAPSQ